MHVDGSTEPCFRIMGCSRFPLFQLRRSSRKGCTTGETFPAICLSNPESELPKRPMGEELAEPLVHQQDCGYYNRISQCPNVLEWEPAALSKIPLLFKSTELVFPNGSLCSFFFFNFFFSTTCCGVILEMTSSDSLQLYPITELSNPSTRAFWNSDGDAQYRPEQSEDFMWVNSR